MLDVTYFRGTWSQIFYRGQNFFFHKRVVKTRVWVICRSWRLRQIAHTCGLVIHDVMRQPDQIIVLLYIFLNKPGKEGPSLWDCKRLRILHVWGAWNLHRQNLNSTWWLQYPLQVMGYHVNFTRHCILIECSRAVRFYSNISLMCNIRNGFRTEWSLITDQIGRREILLPVNHRNYNFQAKLWKRGKVFIKILWWSKPRLWLFDLNYNFECDWLIELSDNNLSSEFFRPITMEEIVIFMMRPLTTVCLVVYL